ncbi:hypothetical protein CXF72_03060 [Psychromonas sp. MB-3u-54]|uniref:hypothetical protein n=1 Tax=Psychromonas sp. MB-3u-54 TaxID=2058319 RepID=UPI000C31C807|nr:hypothetical protein [Psychromonas sp. MB-3u-54]PKH04026.1 hypothetical protein CXF72_03060 [Psychromonas sp. MB-3u-54]
MLLKTIVIENQDVSRDEQYLMHYVKTGRGRYQLLAKKNSDCEPIFADEEMKSLARLKVIVE